MGASGIRPMHRSVSCVMCWPRSWPRQLISTVQVQAPVAPHVLSCEVKQERPKQHEVPPAEQVCPEPTHAAPWQVPNSAPAGTLQVAPLQQSDDAVQMAPMPWQTTGVPHKPLVQICEQQSAENPQLRPFARHSPPPSVTPASPTPPSTGTSSRGRHTPLRHKAPPQQLASVVQVLPSGWQLGVWQRKTPPSPGRQSASLQHWSRNWQTSPSGMQHPASPV